jgi:hypothetical protein
MCGGKKRRAELERAAAAGSVRVDAKTVIKLKPGQKPEVVIEKFSRRHSSLDTLESGKPYQFGK